MRTFLMAGVACLATLVSDGARAEIVFRNCSFRAPD